MQLRYHGAFLEAAVFLVVSGGRPGVPSLQIARFHCERERLYKILDPDERDAAFFRLHLEWFREWGFEKPVLQVLDDFPLLRAELSSLAVRGTANRQEEGAELYVNEAGQRTGLLALTVNRLRNEASLRDYLRHECMHLHDMLDPDFGYSPVLDLAGLNPGQLRVARERYRLLWDITIDGRLSQAGAAPMNSKDRHAAAFGRAYAFWSEEKQAKTLEALWRETAPRHADLLALIADPRGLSNARGPAAGASCPLCGFPTFSWAVAEAVTPVLLRRVKAEFPNWSAEDGLCGRCLEAYQAAENLALAPGR